MTAIKTVGLTKKYKDLTAVDSLDLDIEQGEVFALLGVNGAGKTTTVKMLCCLTKPTLGDAFVLGHSVVKECAKVKAGIGISPQETAVGLHLSVRENLLFMGGVYGFSKEKAQDKMQEMAARFGLQSVLDKKAKTLSGGWQRRLSIAMALIGEPSVLFLDEPTLGLDVVARRELWESIRALKGKVTVVLTTHYMEEAESLSDRIGIMKDGRLLAVGTPKALMERVGAARFEDAFVEIVKGAEV